MSDPPPAEGNAALPARSAKSQRHARWIAPALWALIGSLGVLLVLLYGADRFFGPGQAKTPAPSVLRNPNPGIDGVIALQVPPEQLEAGDCLQGFTDALGLVTIVTCSTSHNAQMIGTFNITEDTFPGSEELMARSQDLCKSVPLDPSSPLDTTWSYHFSRPSEKSWATGDRKVVCFLALNDGTVQDSLLPSSATPISS